MSHITEVKLKVTDLDAVERAAAALGLELVRGQKTHAWFGHFAGDSAEGRRVAAERGVENLGRCEHALRLKGHRAGDYEIGLAANADGSLTPLYDNWGESGRRLERAAGPGLHRLKQEYAVAVTEARVERTLARQGFHLTRESLNGGRVRLRLRRR